MGRVAIAFCVWGGTGAEVRLHLDATHLSLRGDIRVDIPRPHIATVTVTDDGLQLDVTGQLLTIELGPTDAVRWQKALLKSPPSLAEKLGIGPGTPVYIHGRLADADLESAVAGSIAPSPDVAAQILAVVQAVHDLVAAEALAAMHPDLHLWVINPKGPKAPVTSAAIRTYLRDKGYRDSKSCSVSQTLTGTRYRKLGK